MPGPGGVKAAQLHASSQRRCSPWHRLQSSQCTTPLHFPSCNWILITYIFKAKYRVQFDPGVFPLSFSPQKELASSLKCSDAQKGYLLDVSLQLLRNAKCSTTTMPHSLLQPFWSLWEVFCKCKLYLNTEECGSGCYGDGSEG